MVNLAYIHKRRARRIIASVALSCAATLIVIGAIAMLGQKSSPFTVKLTNAGAELSLSMKGSGETTQSRVYIMADDVPEYCVYSVKLLDKKENIDNENTDSEFSYNQDNKAIATRFFKMTFFVENRGEGAADYDLSLTMTNPTYKAANRHDIDSILRVRFYENRVSDIPERNTSNEPVTYAKRSSVPTEEADGTLTWKEHISDKDSPFAEEFLSSKMILRSHVSDLKVGEKIRNTFVMWLEGEDPECVGEESPDSALILGVDISAHEAEANSNQ